MRKVKLTIECSIDVVEVEPDELQWNHSGNPFMMIGVDYVLHNERDIPKYVYHAGTVYQTELYRPLYPMVDPTYALLHETEMSIVKEHFTDGGSGYVLTTSTVKQKEEIDDGTN